MTLRQALVTKLEDFKSSGLTETDYQVSWIRSQIAAEDKRLLLAEVDRLKQERYAFNGSTLDEQLGMDRWILS